MEEFTGWLDSALHKDESILLRERIHRLESALSAANLPYSDYRCQCCHQTYIPRDYDSVRCSLCCQTCYYNREQKAWIQGHLCPTQRVKL